MTTDHDRMEAMANALEHAAKTFREYAQLHYRKGTEEGNVKGATNDSHALVCENALAAYRAQAEEPKRKPWTCQACGNTTFNGDVCTTCRPITPDAR